MPRIPDQAVSRRVERVVESDRELHDAQTGAEVASLSGDHVDVSFPALVGQSAEIFGGELPDIRREPDVIEKCHARDSLKAAEESGWGGLPAGEGTVPRRSITIRNPPYLRRDVT
jgi:hypothetical protein